MASFATHISFGIALGVLSAIAMFALALVPGDQSFPILISLAAVVGAILPDIDSDSGLPFHVTFGSLAIVAGGLSFLYAFRHFPGDYRFLIGAPLGAMLFVWAVLGPIFKKLTHHRGMVHSIPAAFLSGLIIFSLANRNGFEAWPAFLFGLALSVGFILHLILDEVCSAVNFHGKLFVPNKALGSALKFVSNHHAINAAVYASLAFLVVENGDQLSQCATRLSSLLE